MLRLELADGTMVQLVTKGVIEIQVGVTSFELIGIKAILHVLRRID